MFGAGFVAILPRSLQLLIMTNTIYTKAKSILQFKGLPYQLFGEVIARLFLKQLEISEPTSACPYIIKTSRNDVFKNV